MSTAFKSADILLPKNADMSKWAVVACDQYTSEPEYWADVEKITEGARSTLNLILPEVYLEDDNVDERIADIHKNMDSYISEGVFEEYKDAMIYVERTQSDGKVRAGIVGAIDLEEYDYRKGSKSAVRATEATVVERIPPRIKVRRGAPVELPHIMILVDDTEKSVVEPLEAHKGEMKKLYDFDLMKKGGHIAGYLIEKPMQEKIIAALEKLGDIDAFNTKYGLKETSPLVYAMGDGNHSLATAKEFYEEQVKAIAERVTPQAVIAVDALACSELSNLGRTIQLCDTGISPGSGVENARKELSLSTLGVKCIAIGVPTVIDLCTAAQHIFGQTAPESSENIMVAPKTADKLSENCAKLIAMGINRAVHPALSQEDIQSLIC